MDIGFCADTYEVWEFVGQIMTVFKIVIPVIIIIMGAVDLGKAVVSSDEKEIKNATSSLLRRFIAGVVIFFIPTIVNVAFGILSGFDENENDYQVCSSCVANPGNCVETRNDYCIDNPNVCNTSTVNDNSN